MEKCDGCMGCEGAMSFEKHTEELSVEKTIEQMFSLYSSKFWVYFPLFPIAGMRARRRGETRSSDYAAGKVHGSIDRRANCCHTLWTRSKRRDSCRAR